MLSMTNADDSSVHPFFALDDVGCNGTESNLLDCLPQHNCGQNRGAENAGVLCFRKGDHSWHANNKIFHSTIFSLHGPFIYRSQTRAWS